MPDGVAPMSPPGDTLIEWAGAQQRWRTDAPADAVRSAAAHVGGRATLFRGLDKSAGVFTPLSAGLTAIHRRLKQSFDPAGIFNPGRLYADL